jgi:hypothetical protein
VYAYLPDRLDDLLQAWGKPEWQRHKPYGELVRLLLAARPPLVDAALHVAQQASPDWWTVECVLLLLEAAPERVRKWARELAGPKSGVYVRRQVLAQLLRTDVHTHLDLAIEALRSTDDELACVGLEGIARADPMGSLPIMEETALHGTRRCREYAIARLREMDCAIR